jgi:hypothetical protein
MPQKPKQPLPRQKKMQLTGRRWLRRPRRRRLKRWLKLRKQPKSKRSNWRQNKQKIKESRRRPSRHNRKLLPPLLNKLLEHEKLQNQ